MTERYISGQPEGWSETNEGHATIYEMAPSAIPADQAARVIYELRLDVERLNAEVIAAQPIERTWTFTISANFTATNQDDAFNEWSEWLTHPRNVEDGTEATTYQFDANA